MTRLSNNPPPNPPKKHHYIPAFYLSRWAIQGDGRLCQYSRPHETLVANRRHPEATGFLERLYELEGLEDELAQQIESKFFSPVDTGAADALVLMETEGNWAQWDQRRRSAWSRFLHSMLVRAPEDIDSFKAGWRRLLFSDKSGEWEKRYQEMKGANDPPTFNEFLLQFPDDDHNRSAMRALTGMIDNPNMGLKMNRMVWAILDTPRDDHPLLTSDRPIIRTNGMLAHWDGMALGRNWDGIPKTRGAESLAQSLTASAPKLMAIRPPPGQPFLDQDIADIPAPDLDGCQGPAITVGAGGIDSEAVGIQQLQQTGAGAMCERDFGLAATDIVIGFRRVVALEPQVFAIEPHRVAIDNTSVPVAPAHGEAGASFCCHR